MLCARLTRVTPGRPETTLASIVITPREARRGHPDGGRFDGHVVVGGPERDERDEQHVYVEGWDSERPAVDLLQHVLELGQLQRRDEVKADAAVIPSRFAEVLLIGLDHAVGAGSLILSDEELAFRDHLRSELARDRKLEPDGEAATV